MKTKSRGNGQGTAFKRGSTWTACVTVGWRLPDDPSKPKIPIRRTKGGFATKKEAIQFCPTLLNGGVEKKKESPRLNDYWEMYSKEDMLSLGKNTQSAYRTAWKKLKAIHFVRVSDITVDLLRKTVSEQCSSYDTAADCKSLLSNIFTMAAADRFADKNLPSFINLPAKKETERIPFNKKEQEKIWKAYDDGDLRACIPLLMIYTGMMPGEAMKLRVENIDIEHRQILNAGMKTKVRKATPIVLADCLLPVVDDLIKHAMPSGYIWKQKDTDWYDAYYSLLSDLGCRRLTPYSCRHTTATALSVDHNIAPQTIKRIMRWSTVRMLDRYSHPDTADALQGVNTMKKNPASKEQK